MSAGIYQFILGYPIAGLKLFTVVSYYPFISTASVVMSPLSFLYYLISFYLFESSLFFLI